MRTPTDNGKAPVAAKDRNGGYFLLCAVALQRGCQFFQIFFEICTDFGVIKRDFAVCLHNAELIAHIIANAVEINCVEFAAAGKVKHGVGEIDFAALGRRGFSQSNRKFQAA